MSRKVSCASKISIMRLTVESLARGSGAGGPTDRVQALRKAFDDTVTDPQFIVAAKQANMYINPMGGEELQAIVSKIAGPPGTDADVAQASDQDLQNPGRSGGARGNQSRHNEIIDAASAQSETSGGKALMYKAFEGRQE
jgi:hypothetical protein